VTLYVDPEADDALAALHATDPATAQRVEQTLDLIETDPGAAAVRRRALRPVGLRMLIVPRGTDEGDLAILWELDGDDPVVRYLGSDRFT